MPQYVQLSEEFLPEDYVPDWSLLQSAVNEHPFMDASFNLLLQCSHIATIIVNLKPVKPLDRNQAIVVGLMVRLTKLLKVILRDLSNHECFQQLSISRQFIETAATIEYLLADDEKGQRYDQYVKNSLVAEREMLVEIKRSVQARGGDSQHIEIRMRRSIAKTAKAAGIDDVSKLPSRKTIGFPSAEERIKQLGDKAYMAYRSGSSEVHGDWTDLYKHHLEFDGIHFTPYYEEPHPRPQISTALTTLTCRTMIDYLDTYEDKQVSDAFKVAMNDVWGRVSQLTQLHEEFLERASGKNQA